jgi:flagellar biosynthetic protein FliO
MALRRTKKTGDLVFPPVRLFTITILFCVVSFAVAQQDTSGLPDINKINQYVASPGGQSLSAVSPAAPQKSGNVKGENFWFIALRITGYLALVIVLIYGASWGIKKLGLAAGGSKVSNGSMDLLEVLPLGQNRSLMLVRVMDAVFLLSQTPSQIALVEKIEGPRALELISTTKGGVNMMQFKDLFDTFVGKFKKHA